MNWNTNSEVQFHKSIWKLGIQSVLFEENKYRKYIIYYNYILKENLISENKTVMKIVIHQNSIFQ